MPRFYFAAFLNLADKLIHKKGFKAFINGPQLALRSAQWR